MVFIQADDISKILFIVFSLAMAGTILFAVRSANYRVKQFTILFVAYLFMFSAIVHSGLVIKFVIPLVPILFLTIIGCALFFALSGFGLKLSQTFSLAALIGFQSFRFPLELILHQWSKTGTVPATMTWTGQNWDIVTGIISLLSVPIVAKSKHAAWFVQLVGFLLLLNVIRVVIMSSPFPFSWSLDNPIQLIGYMPYALIGPLFVGPALAGHIIVFRKLLECK